ncbi:MAG: hypothetical protein IT426_04065 [Pirellulales bacterium]|nr:hypothetical protein [Pirellulales bacterium]
MFHFHDKTRRKLAIAGFIFLCFLPTCAVAGWCLWRNLPWETRLAAERLQMQLGWKVNLEQLRHPRPGADVYQNLELFDPETGQFVFSCKSVEVGRRSVADPQGREKPTLVLSIEQPEIDAAALGKIGRFVERLLQDHAAPGMDCRISAAELKLRRGKTIETFTGIEAGVDHSPGCVQAAMQFHLPEAKNAAPVSIRFYRDRSTAPPQNRFQLITAENEVPCDLIALGIPEFAQYGARSRFQGTIEFDYSQKISLADDWSDALTGRIIDADSGAETRLPVK